MWNNYLLILEKQTKNKIIKKNIYIKIFGFFLTRYFINWILKLMKDSSNIDNYNNEMMNMGVSIENKKYFSKEDE